MIPKLKIAVVGMTTAYQDSKFVIITQIKLVLLVALQNVSYYLAKTEEPARGWQGTTCEEKVVFDDILRAEVERQMMLNSAKTNDEFRDILHRYLTGLYSNYFFTVNAYDEVIGSEAHSVIGTYVQFIKTHKRNLVVGWAKKNSVFPPTAKLNEISAAVHRSVNGFNKEAKASAEKAWGVANSFKFPLVMTHVVRFGCGLRSKFSGVTSFQNFTVGGHDSSVVVMFGSP